MNSKLELHPRNQAFVWRDPDQPLALLADEQCRAYCEDGGFVYSGAFSEAEIDAVVAAIDPLEAEAQQRLAAMDGGGFGIARADEIVFSPHLVARSEVLRSFARHPLLVQLAKDLMGPKPRLYWDQLVYKKPGTRDEFPWHQDNGYTYVEPQQYLTCWVALTDASEDNGCPWIVPGIHRRGTLAHQWTALGFQCFPDHAEAVPMPAKKGDIVVFSSLTPHRTGPNLTTMTRKSYILQYTADGAMMFPHNQPPLPADNPDWQFLLEDELQERAL
jgi:ectoine hydroxylase-related dioxygenase (phytanoyl-CoA dioxygenase family)